MIPVMPGRMLAGLVMTFPAFPLIVREEQKQEGHNHGKGQGHGDPFFFEREFASLCVRNRGFGSGATLSQFLLETEIAHLLAGALYQINQAPAFRGNPIGS